MNLRHNKSFPISYLALAFILPCALMLFVMAVSKYEPFGNYSMLYSDMYHQYYPFFVAFRDALRSGKSLLYSWNVGLGMDYLGLISYYLASPLNLLSVFVPEGLLLEFFSLLMPVKLGLAGLFFAIFLKRLFGEDNISISVFGGLYGLCAWALGYQWNVMWLDTFALLPLVALGTVELLRDKKYVLYTLTLALSIFMNYYIGLFVCFFVFLFFFAYEICRWKGIGRFFSDLVRIGFFSLLAIGMTAILELPALAALQTTQSSVNNFPTGFRMNIASENTWKGLLSAMRQVAGNMGGGIKPTFKEGLPNLYCGVGTVMLAFLFLLSKNIRLRDKLCSVALLLFFILSFILRQLDYIWHGFHFPNMIPYRFSFLYSFVMLYMAYRAWLSRRTLKPWQVLTAFGLSVLVFACGKPVESLDLFSGDVSREAWIYLAFNGISLVAYTVIFLVGLQNDKPKRKENREAAKEMAGDAIEEDTEAANDEADETAAELEAEAAQYRRRAVMSYALVGVMVLELIANIVNFGFAFTGTSVSNYPHGTDKAASMIRYMKEREEDTLFFRAETTHSQTLNDGALNGYNGVSTFTSSANVKVTEFMRTLGYAAKNTYNRYCYEEASPVSNLFLNLKYMIERTGKNKQSTYFKEIHRYGDVALLQNLAYLPLGFLAEEELGELDFGMDVNRFRFQNALVSAASGLEEDVWRLLGRDELEIFGADVTVTDWNETGYCTYQDGVKGGYLNYSYLVESDGFLCVDVTLPNRNNVSIWKNGVELYEETISLQQMLAVGDVFEGDLVEIHVTCKTANESGTATVSAAILDADRFRACYEVLLASRLNLTEFSNTKVSGTISCNRDGLLYTSIPQNGNWYAQVDGQDAEVILVGDAMVGVALTEGDHEVTFTYRSKAFDLGWKVSLSCVLLFAVLVYVSWLNSRKKEKPIQ